MLCKDLKDGMLLRLSKTSKENNIVGVVGLHDVYLPYERLTFVSTDYLNEQLHLSNIQINEKIILENNDFFLYVGLCDIDVPIAKCKRKIRLVLYKSQLFYVEGFDFKYLEELIPDEH